MDILLDRTGAGGERQERRAWPSEREYDRRFNVKLDRRQREFDEKESVGRRDKHRTAMDNYIEALKNKIDALS